MGKPLWRQAVDGVERAVGPHLERGVQTGTFADSVALIGKSSKALQRFMEDRTRAALHLVNLPAATDVRRLRRQVAALDREIRLLREVMQNEREERHSDDSRGGAPGTRRPGEQAPP